MKCQPVACIWSDSPPPLHQVTATAVLNHPPTLYTGGSDGSIIWWSFSSNLSQQNIWPVAMLCGHASRIVDLDICFPVTMSGGHEEMENTSNAVVNSSSSSAGYGALISACTDGVLCIWSRESGHCKRRRKMPPWAGTPSAISTLPASPRYVCVACCSVDSVNSSNSQYSEPAEGGEASVDRESHNRRGSKCAIVIFDTYSLNIVQTVFHGSLSIGPLKFMAVVLSAENYGKQSVILSDSFGGLQSVMISKESETGSNALPKSSSQVGISASVDGLLDGEYLVSIVAHGDFLALIYRACFVFRLVGSGNVIGKIDLVDSPLIDDSPSFQSHLVGGMFLSIDDGESVLATRDPSEQFEEIFVVWSNRGAAIVFTISGSHDTFKHEPLYEIPAISHPLNTKSSVNFTQLNGNLMRVESRCYLVEESLLWKPHITMWLLCQQHDSTGKFGQQCRMLGEGGFPCNWIRNSSPLWSSVFPIGKERTLSEICDSELIHLNSMCGETVNSYLILQERVVSSSLVLSEKFDAPYGIVYGFYTGEIEVVRFRKFFQGLGSSGESSDGKPEVFEQSFLGHQGPILCLAAHRMSESVNEQKTCWFLVSGSMDCTIRIWDLDSRNLVTVMHHHVAPVRQIILPPPHTDRPWSDCFISVGEDSCVSLVSLETLRVERMFPGHLNYPAMVVWDGVKGYIACLCKNHFEIYATIDVLYLWDVKTGGRERVLRGTASHSMFDHFCKGINVNSITDSILGGITSASSLLLPIVEDGKFPRSHSKDLENGVASLPTAKRRIADASRGPKEKSAEQLSASEMLHYGKHPIKCMCPFPGMATLRFDLSSLVFPCQSNTQPVENGSNLEITGESERRPDSPCSSWMNPDAQRTTHDPIEEHEWVKSLEGCLIRFSLSFLHLWGVDHDLDRLLLSEMNVIKPDNFILASGLQGDRGSVTLTFPSPHATLELWRSSSEFCAIRSLTMVSLAQHMISLSRSSSAASSALAAFYTRKMAEIVPDVKPPSLQLLVSFWQDKSEHVRMAARSLFHCAASRAIPHPLSRQRVNQHGLLPVVADTGDMEEQKHLYVNETSRISFTDGVTETTGNSEAEDSAILTWLESFEMQDWISCVGGTSQDAMASLIIVAAALAVWYPSLVKPNVARLVVHPLVKLVMAMSDKYSATAAELLAEGMESTWKSCIGPEIPRLIGDIFFQIECVSGASAIPSPQNSSGSVSMRETLAGILLPSLAMADVLGFLNVIESQIWSTASDSPVHVVALVTLIRVLRGSPKPLAPFLDKAVNFIFQTMDYANLVLRKSCLPNSMHALKEIVRVFPMISLNQTSSRLAVGDAIGDINSVTIRIYDMQSVTILKVLDASGPPGLPSLLGGASDTSVTTGISALSFSPNGEGLVAFSEHGLMIRWWSLESGWWEKLSRSLVPIQCTKLIFVPPWEGFSPNSSRTSVMASIIGHDRKVSSPDKSRGSNDVDNLNSVLHSLDLSYRIEWVEERRLILMHHGHELGSFQL